ncbi:MAG: discoidin domain-containing protein, partial [Phycisphaerales bacterium]
METDTPTIKLSLAMLGVLLSCEIAYCAEPKTRGNCVPDHRASDVVLSNAMHYVRPQKQILSTGANLQENLSGSTEASHSGGVYADYVGAGHADGVVATASSTDDIASAMNTVNGSGLDGDFHSGAWEDTWTSDGDAENPPAPSPNPDRGNSQWIHYDLGHAYLLGRMHVWNGNEVSARGLKEVTIDYSADGITWNELGTFNFPQAPGSNRYTGFDGPDFGGVCARYVLLTIHSNHGGEYGYSISEVKISVGLLGTGTSEIKVRDKSTRQNRTSGSAVERISKPVWTKADRFGAEGNTDPNHRAPRRKRGEVIVSFDLLPTRMSFNLPSFPCLVT